MTTTSFYKDAKGYRQLDMHQYLCVRDTEDIVEYAMDEVDDTCSPHESKKGT